MLTLVTGGSGSGKSAFAEELAVSLGEPRIYLATMQCYDAESKSRINRHRKQRAGKGFETVECGQNLQKLRLTGQPVVLLECMSNLVANERFGETGDRPDDQCLAGKILAGVKSLAAQCSQLVVVTNEIFSDGVEYDPETRAYQQLLADVNCQLAALADQVIEVTCGCTNVLCKRNDAEPGPHGRNPGQAQGGWKLYLGGYAQGKLDYVKKHEVIPGASTDRQWSIVDGDLDFLDLCGKVREGAGGQIHILNHTHLLIRHLLEQGQDADAFFEALWQQNPELILICDEVGLGVVPMDPMERRWREKVGRLCCKAAERARRVVRITCGTGQVLKGA